MQSGWAPNGPLPMGLGRTPLQHRAVTTLLHITNWASSPEPAVQSMVRAPLGGQYGFIIDY